MHTLRHTTLLLVAALLAVLLAACGSASSTSGSGSSTSSSSATSTPTSSSYSNGYGSTSTPTATATAATSGAALITTATVTVKGQSMTVLTNAAGDTLYYLKSDTTTKAVCTGSCAKIWPPLLASGSAAPTSATTLTGALTVQSSANGSQVQYNGHFLYTFSGDSAPGQANGQGFKGVWFVATPSLAAA